MRVRIVKPRWKLEFDGPASVWNDLLRPVFGGPEAADEPSVKPPAPASSAPSGAPRIEVRESASAPRARTFYPSRDESQAPTSWSSEDAETGDDRPREPRFRDGDRPRRGEPHPEGGSRRHNRPDGESRRHGPEPTIQIEPSADPRTLYERLAALGSRRVEKDSVLAAVWFIGRGEREVTDQEVARHIAEHGGPEDFSVRPHLFKHVTRSKCLDHGEKPGSVRLTEKGRAQVRLLTGE